MNLNRLTMLFEMYRWRIYGGLFGLLLLFTIAESAAPLQQELAEIDEQINRLERQLSIAAIAPNEEQTTQTLDSLRVRIRNLTFAESNKTRISRIVALLNAAAETYQIEIQTIEPNEPTALVRHVELSMTLRLVGRYHNLGRFVNALETGELIIKTHSLKALAPEMVSSKLKIELKVIVYLLKSETGVFERQNDGSQNHELF